jgi:hypothetical protein
MDMIRARKIYFVISAVDNNKLISEQIEAKSISQSVKLFKDQFGVEPQQTFGPFYRKC